jgi:hypothetical protein
VSLESGFNEDFLDMLRALVDRGAEFLVVGASRPPKSDRAFGNDRARSEGISRLLEHPRFG